jgi:hypothetical protein
MIRLSFSFLFSTSIFSQLANSAVLAATARGAAGSGFGTDATARSGSDGMELPLDQQASSCRCHIVWYRRFQGSYLSTENS